MSQRHNFIYAVAASVIIISLVGGALYYLNLWRPSTDVDSLNFYTEQFPPYNYQENGTLRGLAVELLDQIIAKMGSKIAPSQIHLSSWTEAYQAALTSKNAVVFSTARLPQREQLFKWAGPISTDRYVLFARWDSGISINNTGDLKNYRIGVVTDNVGILQLQEAGVDRNRLVYGTNASAFIEKLSAGQIELWCYPEIVGRQIMQQVTGDYYTFKAVYTLEEINTYYAFNKDISDSTVKSFQQALDALKIEKDATGISTYDRIMGRYIPSVGLSQLNYLTEEWAPFNYQVDGTPTGISVEILEAIFQNMGVNRTGEDIAVVPLSEGLAKAQENTSTVVFSIVRNAARESLYKWAGPFTKSSFVIFAPLSRNVTIASGDDLNNYRIGAVTSTIENDLLVEAGYNRSKIVNALIPDDLVQMFKNEQIDLWATGDLTGRYELSKNGLDPEAYEVVYVLSENEFYYIFSRDVPDLLVNSFQRAIEFVRYQRDAQGVTEYERIIYKNLGVGFARQSYSNDAVIGLVNATAAAIEKNATDTFRRINAGEDPYRSKQYPGLYAFVYDTNTTMVAHGENILMVGDNYKGKTDVTGKAFRDDIITGALQNGTGWVDYVYMNPAQPNLYYKTTYYRLVNGSDGYPYILCAGNYKSHE